MPASVRPPTFPLVLLLAGAACGSGDPKDSSTGDTSEATGDASTGTSGSSEPTTGGGSASSSSGGGPVCEVTPDLDACAACSNMNCCAEIEACQAEPACDCMTNCVTGLADISMCTMKCGTSTNFSPLTMCTILHCAADCT